MTYTKPKNVKYTDMAIYIDNHIYGEYNELVVYEYLYHICTMLSYKFGYFESGTDYDEFGIYCAGRYFLRLTNKKSEKIKSILNYIKRTLHLLKYDYLEESRDVSNVECECSDVFSMRNILIDEHSDLAIVDFKTSLQDINKTCQQILKSIPIKRDSSEWRDIYISCLLTFINSITLPDTYDYRNKRETTLKNDYNKQNDVVLYHLNPNMKSYIKGLVTKLKYALGEDLSAILDDYIYIDDMCKYGMQEEYSDEY